MAEQLRRPRNSVNDKQDRPQFTRSNRNTVSPRDTPLPNVNDESAAPGNSQATDLRHGKPSLKRHHSESEPETIQALQDDSIYGASHFGQYGEYMRRKRAKLQIQNDAIERNSSANAGNGHGIFEGLAIYINGWTQPSVQDLRKLIVENSGIYKPYLDRKSIVTHIVTCSLTPAKVREFKHMKVVRPEWITESVAAGRLLSWRNYIFKPNERTESTQGSPKKQMTILDMTHSLKSSTSSNNSTSIKTITEDSMANQSPTKKGEVVFEQSDLLFTSDPSTEADAARIPGYASAASNPHAQRAMADPEWRKAHTSIAPTFIEGYYKNSRLHHLSTWKAELRSLIAEAQERADLNGSAMSGNSTGVSMRGTHFAPRKWKGKGKAGKDDFNERVIMHCDFDCFFVSAGLVSRPELKGKPVVVCHSQGARSNVSSTSEIASCSYEAREFGIRNGMSLQQAKRLCPDVVTIPYEFERYKEFSLKFYTVLLSFADDLQAVSVDEALIDVTDAVRARSEVMMLEIGDDHGKDPAKEVAESIRAEIRRETSCEVSIGIAHNILLARLATRRAKPANSYHLFPDDVSDHLSHLEISDLHGFGYQTKQKAIEKLGTSKLGELLNKGKQTLCDALGKTTGETLYKAIRGIDEKQLESSKERKSVSCDINYGIRFENNEQAETFIYQMAEEIERRLDEVKMLGRMITLKILKRDPTAPVEPPKFLGHGICNTFSKQSKLMGLGESAVNDSKIIGEHAWKMLRSFNFDPKELRGIGIQIQRLEPAEADLSSVHGKQSILQFEVKDVQRPVSKEKYFSNSTAPSEPAAVQVPPLPEPLTKDNREVQNKASSSGPTPENLAYVDLPSFSQVDISVFEALPRDVKEELEMEYKRRSVTPAVESAGAGPSKTDLRQVQQNRQPSVPLRGNKTSIFPGKSSPTKATNYRRITQQLAPRNGRSIYANKSLLHALGLDKPKAPSVSATDEELRALDIDPQVFAMLPVKIQREQLVRARLIKKNGSIPDEPTQRKILKPDKPFASPSRRRRRVAAPKAYYVNPPVLHQQGKNKGEKLYFTETDDIQEIIEKWMTTYRRWAPKEKDIEFFSKYLVQCVESKEGDSGVERAIAVMKWWLVLLKRFWPDIEQWEDEGVARDSNERAGIAWWKAFHEIKRRLDGAAKKRFGGQLSLK